MASTVTVAHTLRMSGLLSFNYAVHRHRQTLIARPEKHYRLNDPKGSRMCIVRCHDLFLHGLSISACPPSLCVSLSQIKSPGSCSSHVASSTRTESAHPPILLPWHFQENPSRLGACLVNPREWGRECNADLAVIALSAGSSRGTDAQPLQPS